MNLPPRRPPTARVFRLIKRGDCFPPTAAKPLPGAFRLTNDDYDDAQRRRMPPLLSVWMHDATTVSQSRAFVIREGEYEPFQWPVEDVEKIAEGDVALTVHEDPLEDERAGAAGHSGICGLGPADGRPKGEAKRIYKALANQLAEAATSGPLEEPSFAG